jgi:hypothetical protein
MTKKKFYFEFISVVVFFSNKYYTASNTITDIFLNFAPIFVNKRTQRLCS